MRGVSVLQGAVGLSLLAHLSLFLVVPRDREVQETHTQRIRITLPAQAENDRLPQKEELPLPLPVKKYPLVENNIQPQKMTPRPEPLPVPAVQPPPLPVEPVAAVQKPSGPALPTQESAPLPPVSSPPAVNSRHLEEGEAEARRPGRLDEYLVMLKGAVERNKLYPSFARQMGLQGTVVIRVTLSVDGAIMGMAVLNSSGQRTLDRAAESAIRASAPFKPPRQFGLGEVTVDIPIVYRLTQ